MGGGYFGVGWFWWGGGGGWVFVCDLAATSSVEATWWDGGLTEVSGEGQVRGVIRVRVWIR